MGKKILFAIYGWSGNEEAWDFPSLKYGLEGLPIEIVTPHYLDATGIFARFKSHRTAEEYALSVEEAFLKMKQENPDAKIYVLGYSLGGIIVRLLYNKGLFSEKNMILVGTPNRGIYFGFFKTSILKVLARLCKVPILFQLLEGSEFIRHLNGYYNGIPQKAHYISGEIDNWVPRDSSDPLGIGIIVPQCGHKLFPLEREKVEFSAIPYVRRILEKDLEYK